MSEPQPEYDPRQQGPATPPPWGQEGDGQFPARYGDLSPAPRQYQALQPSAVRTVGLTAAGSFWYILQCIWFGAGYFAKVPAKKALQDAGLAQMTSAEQFWYVLMCISFGAGYFAKLPIAKALSEMQRY